MVSRGRCRLCAAPLDLSVIDLGSQPLANDLAPSAASALAAERYPLHARACSSCWLVQLDATVPPSSMFSDYAYLSSYSSTWLAHVEDYATWAVESFGLGEGSTVVEIGSNDGCLLECFARRDIDVLGVDPAENLAGVAAERGVRTVVDFFGRRVAEALVADGVRPDLVVANNVFAHVPDLLDVVEGFAVLAAAGAAITIEVPHLLATIDGLAFDTVYHEHVSYFSLATARRALATGGLEVVDVVSLPTHGGSLRLVVRPSGSVAPSASVDALLAREHECGLEDAAVYERFAERARACIEGLAAFLAEAAGEGGVMGYGAPAKATVLLNAAGATSAHVTAIADRNPRKVGRFVPGTGVPIVPVDELRARRPGRVLVLPWNLEQEIAAELADVRASGAELLVAVPHLRSVVATEP